MKDHGFQFELSVVEIAAIDHGLEGEVIVLHNQMFVCFT